ncbi:MAG: hypothetical protein R3230_00980 [Nitrosopumilaceae archaeon]|nr:hypothetical protein [Nitrosopumilaceae archaeon]
MLPKIQHSIYTHHLKGIDKKIKFRPYTNREQKILLIAKEEGLDDRERVLEAVIQVLNNCIVDNIDVMSLSTFDIEDLFIRIRAKSVGEIITIKRSYNYEDENGATKTDFVAGDIDINQIELKMPDVDPVIIVDKSQNIGIKLRYPSIKDVMEMGDSASDEDLLKRCIVSIFDSEQVYDITQASDDEINEFIADIEGEPLLKISQFFKQMPALSHTKEFYLPKLDKTETVEFQGLADFFI